MRQVLRQSAVDLVLPKCVVKCISSESSESTCREHQNHRANIYCPKSLSSHKLVKAAASSSASLRAAAAAAAAAAGAGGALGADKTMAMPLSVLAAVGTMSREKDAARAA